MIYGDKPQQIGEYEDPLGTSRHVYAPQVTAIMQAGCLYGYGLNNPVKWIDPTGRDAIAELEQGDGGGMSVALNVLAIAVFVGITNASKKEEKVKPKPATSTPAPPPPPNKNNKPEKNRNIKQISKKIVNEVAEFFGYENAEAFKADFVGKDNGKSFDMYTDTKTHEIILQNKAGTEQVPTGLYWR